MDVKCSLCGKTDKITKMHKDYIAIARKKTTYVCEMCQSKVRFHAMEQNKPKKPM